MSESLMSPPTVPHVRPPKRKPRGVWANMNAEERSAYAKRISACNDHSKPIASTRRGRARHLTNAQYDVAIDSQRPVIAKIMRKMDERGELPDNPMAVEALESALLVLRSPVSTAERTAAARAILDFTKPKPSARVETTLRTAEDWVDEMAAEGSGLGTKR